MASHFRLPKAGKTAKYLWKSWTRRLGQNKAITGVRPKGPTHLTIRPEHITVRGVDQIDVPKGEPSYFSLTHERVEFHSFVGNTF